MKKKYISIIIAIITALGSITSAYFYGTKNGAYDTKTEIIQVFNNYPDISQEDVKNNDFIQNFKNNIENEKNNLEKTNTELLLENQNLKQQVQNLESKNTAIQSDLEKNQYDDIRISIIKDNIKLIENADSKIHNGEIYISQEALKKLTNQNIEWDGISSTLYVGNKGEKLAKEIFLFDKPFLDVFHQSDFKHYEEDGNNYLEFNFDNSLRKNNPDGTYESESYVVYPLNGKCSRIQGTIKVKSSSTKTDQVKFIMYDENNNPLYESSIITYGIEPQIIDFIPPANCLKLKILAKATHSYRYTLSAVIENLTITTTDYK